MIPQHGTLEISESRLQQNLNLLYAKLPKGVRICATIKANAYGHGRSDVQSILARSANEWYCTYTQDEALIALIQPAKEYSLKVLVIAPTVEPADNNTDLDTNATVLGNWVFTTNLRLTVVDGLSAVSIDRLCANFNITRKILVHVQIDTGLSRSGVSIAEAPGLLQQILRLPNLHLEGIFTHLSHGDAPGHPTIADQIATLHKIADPIKREHPDIIIHAQNSGGTFNFSDASLDMVRVGIALYGLQPSLDDPIPGLQPIARLVAPILMIHDRPANTGVGYGHTFTTQRPSRLAIVPVGYADGYPRAMSNRGIVQIRGQNAPVVGRVSMDQIIVDVTDIPAAAPGDEVTVFSNDPTAPNCIDQIAKACGTIGYEIATGMGARLVRRIVD